MGFLWWRAWVPPPARDTISIKPKLREQTAVRAPKHENLQLGFAHKTHPHLFAEISPQHAGPRYLIASGAFKIIVAWAYSSTGIHALILAFGSGLNYFTPKS